MKTSFWPKKQTWENGNDEITATAIYSAGCITSISQHVTYASQFYDYYFCACIVS